MPPPAFVILIPSMRLVEPAADGKYTAEQLGWVPIVQKSDVGHGFPVALSVVTAGPSVEMIVMFAVTRMASRYVPGRTLIVPPVILMLQIAVWILQ